MYLSKVPKYRADAQSYFSTLSMGSVPARVPVMNSKLEVWEKFQPILYFDGMLVSVQYHLDVRVILHGSLDIFQDI